MKQILTIAKKEFRSFFGSILGYIVLAIFLLGGGFFLWIFPNQYNIIDSGYAALDGLFAITPYLFLFLCPAITMRSFAEERQQGTLELLLARPVSKRRIVVGKSLGSWAIVIVALLFVLVWYVSVSMLASPKGNVDSGAFWGSMLGLLFLSAIYIAIGIFSSSITGNQIFAFVLGATMSFVMFKGFDFVGLLFVKGNVTDLISALGINYHYKSISRGVVDSRDVVYFLVATFVFIYATIVVLNRKGR